MLEKEINCTSYIEKHLEDYEKCNKEERIIKKLKAIKECGNKCYIYNFEAGTILNLIQKQQEELTRKKTDLQNAWHNNLELAEKCLKQDKIIDEMACTIYDYANLGKLKICDCELEDGKIDLNLCNQTLADRNCSECIKQFFEKKVGESSK